MKKILGKEKKQKNIVLSIIFHVAIIIIVILCLNFFGDAIISMLKSMHGM